MKILVLSFYYEPDLSAGSFRTTSLVKSLLTKGCNIEVITTKPNRYSSFQSKASSFERSDNLKIHRINIPKHNSGMKDQVISFYFYYKEALKIAKVGDYNLIYATSSRLFTAFLGARLSKTLKIPLYLDIRDLFYDTLKDLLDKNFFKFIKYFLNAIEKYTFKNASKVNLVSYGFKDYFDKKYNFKNLSFFSNGIDDAFQNIPHKNFKKENHKKTVVTYAGNIGDGQGLEKIIPALAINHRKSHIFQVIGDGGKKTQFIEATKNIENIRYIKPMAQDQLIDFYMSSDVLLLHLNDYDAFKKVLPSKIFEYAATGRPIIAGVAGYPKFFINMEVKNAFTFKPQDVDDASRVLKDIELKSIDRKEFKLKFNRESIMNEMSDDIIEIGKNVEIN